MVSSTIWLYRIVFSSDDNSRDIRKFSDYIVDSAIEWAEQNDLCVVVRYDSSAKSEDMKLRLGILLGTTFKWQIILESTASELIPHLQVLTVKNKFNMTGELSCRDDDNFFGLKYDI